MPPTAPHVSNLVGMVLLPGAPVMEHDQKPLRDRAPSFPNGLRSGIEEAEGCRQACQDDEVQPTAECWGSSEEQPPKRDEGA